MQRGLQSFAEIEDFSEDQIKDVQNLLELKDAVENDWPMIFEILLDHRVMPFHQEWVEFQFENPWSIILGPRGYGKTQICVKDYAILKSLRSREDRLLILGKTLPQGRSILREVRYHLEKNDFTQIFGKFFEKGNERTEKSQTELFFHGRQAIFSEPNISALGIGGSIISRHFTCVLADDLVDSSNASGRSGDLLYQWVKEEVMPMILPGGEFHIIGSSWGTNDLYHRLMKESDEGKEGFAYRVYSAEDKDRESVWKEWISTEQLRVLESRMGTAFYMAQLLNDVRFLEKGRRQFFKDDVMIRKRSEIMRKIDVVVVGVDPATGSGGNWTGVCVVGRLKEPDPELPRYWILELHKEQFGSTRTKELLRVDFKRFKPDMAVVEAVGYQKDLANELAEEFPVEQKTPRHGKATRFISLGARFQQGQVGCCEECWELMEDFWYYPDSGYSVDVIDACEDAVSYFMELEEDQAGEYDEVDMRTPDEQRDDKYRERFKEKFGETVGRFV